jgi:hypothetical protein
MKKIYILLLAFSISSISMAQSGNHQIIAGVELGLPVGDFDGYKAGFGFVGKALFGFSDHSQIGFTTGGFTTGYTAFKAKGSTDDYKVKTSVVPFLATYRHHFSIFYVEPQLGYGSYTTTIKEEVGGNEQKTTMKDGAFTWAFGAGLQVSSIDLGLRYQAGHKDGGTVGFFGIHAGYIFQGGGRK